MAREFTKSEQAAGMNRYMSLGISFGVAFGAAFGAAFGNVSDGIVFGLTFGLLASHRAGIVGGSAQARRLTSRSFKGTAPRDDRGASPRYGIIKRTGRSP